MANIATLEKPIPKDEVEWLRKTLTARGVDIEQATIDGKETAVKLPILERRVRFAQEVAEQPMRPIVSGLAGILHDQAKHDIDTFVQVTITPQYHGVEWNVGEMATIWVDVTSMHFPMKDLVLELRVNDAAALKPIHIGGMLYPADKRFLAELEPGPMQTHRFFFWAMAVKAEPATFSAVLTAEVVPYAARYPAKFTVPIAPAP